MHTYIAMNQLMKSDNNNQTQSQSIQDRVFAAIEEQQVEPRSKYLFAAQNAAIWSMWLCSVCVGSVAVAVVLFASTYTYYDVYEAMYDNFATAMIEALPLLWLLILAVMVAMSSKWLKATNRGYRFPTSIVALSSVALSILFGFIMSGLGFGQFVDQNLGTYAPMYYSLAEREKLAWQQPEEGRLIGQIQQIGNVATKTVSFTDIASTSWHMDISDLQNHDKNELAKKKLVRVLGVQIESNSSKPTFYACGVFPWMIEEKRPMKELSKQRRAAIEGLYRHMDSKDKLNQEKLFTESDIKETGENHKICANIAAVSRLTKKKQ